MPTKQDLFEFIKSWTDGLSMIRTAYEKNEDYKNCLLYTSPSPRDVEESRMPSSA